MCIMVTKVAKANQIDVALDCFHIKNSIKDSTRAISSNDVEPIEYVNLLLESLPPVKFERFWASSKARMSCRIYLVNVLKRKPKKRTLL